MKTAEDFQQAAKDRKISEWRMHDCCLCGYSCGYVFGESHELVAYDSGCDCTRRYVCRPTTWDNVAKFYNMQESPKVIEEMNKFWGFKDVPDYPKTASNMDQQAVQSGLKDK